MSVAPPAPAAAPDVSLTLLTDELPGQAVALANAGDGSGRLFIVLKQGSIVIWDGSQLLAPPFLDIDSLVMSGANDERGLLGLAFHPDYASTGYFFVNYINDSSDTVIARYQVWFADPNLADTSSAAILMTVTQPSTNHNGGQLAFGKDGYLYIGLGDGGGGGDPGGNARDLASLLGSVLRIDVDTNAGTSPYYSSPPDNPFFGGGDGARDEIWAFGLRNPWRFSFDRVTGDLFIGDVGQGAYEEIDFEPWLSAGGLDFGWDCAEGAHAYTGPPDGPTLGCSNDPSTYELPIIEYGHGAGDCAVIAGFRYRGAFHPPMAGRYFYADYCTGNLWAASESGGVWTSDLLLTAGFGITSFGEDEDGELYLVQGTGLYRLDEPDGIFGDGFEAGDLTRWSGSIP